MPGDQRDEAFCRKLIGRASEELGQPVEIAPVYVLLASAEASDVTRQVYGASGGRGEP